MTLRARFLIFFASLFVCGLILGCGRIVEGKYKEKINLTPAELSQYDGKDGRPAFVAVDGVVYDITKCRDWRNGEHPKSNGRAVAGRDLSNEIKVSKHGVRYLKRYPIVGYLVESKE